MRHNERGRTVRATPARASVALVAVGIALAVAPARAASAESPAVIGPVLQVLTFGTDVGVPTGCQAGSAVVGSGTAEAGLAQPAAPVIQAINAGCGTVQVQGGKYIAVGQTISAPAKALNPYVNPVLGQAADSSDQLAADHGSSLAPFGGLLAGLGAIINFFQGK